MIHNCASARYDYNDNNILFSDVVSPVYFKLTPSEEKKCAEFIKFK